MPQIPASGNKVLNTAIWIWHYSQMASLEVLHRIYLMKLISFRSHFYQTRSAWSVDQGSNKNHSPAYNFAPTVTKFCVMWEGLSLPHDTKFGNCRCKIVDSRAFPSWSLIHGLRWSGLIKAEPGWLLIVSQSVTLEDDNWASIVENEMSLAYKACFCWQQLNTLHWNVLTRYGLQLYILDSTLFITVSEDKELDYNDI